MLVDQQRALRKGDMHKSREKIEVNTPVVLELAVDVHFSAWTWKIRQTGSKTWHEHANTVLILSVDIKYVDVDSYVADMALTLQGAHL